MQEHDDTEVTFDQAATVMAAAFGRLIDTKLPAPSTPETRAGFALMAVDIAAAINDAREEELAILRDLVDSTTLANITQLLAQTDSPQLRTLHDELVELVGRWRRFQEQA